MAGADVDEDTTDEGGAEAKLPVDAPADADNAKGRISRQ